MDNPFFGLMPLFMLLYLVLVVGVVVLFLVAFWRIVRAQEATARSLAGIERILAERAGP